ncbi:hypothetical protein SBA6_210022 [Candidatus Sulfopaludibacter sp. SbA6]|nr:hypothetical protein SBA6_210022 [Candidatus Sulfopaludibacter sp. SbA6]
MGNRPHLPVSNRHLGHCAERCGQQHERRLRRRPHHCEPQRQQQRRQRHYRPHQQRRRHRGLSGQQLQCRLRCGAQGRHRHRRPQHHACEPHRRCRHDHRQVHRRGQGRPLQAALRGPLLQHLQPPAVRRRQHQRRGFGGLHRYRRAQRPDTQSDAVRPVVSGIFQQSAQHSTLAEVYILAWREVHSVTLRGAFGLPFFILIGTKRTTPAGRPVAASLRCQPPIELAFPGSA